MSQHRQPSLFPIHSRAYKLRRSEKRNLSSNCWFLDKTLPDWNSSLAMRFVLFFLTLFAGAWGKECAMKPTPDQNIDTLFLLAAKIKFFTLMASEGHFGNWMTALKGPAKDFSKLCLTSEIKGTQVHITALGNRKIVQDCALINAGAVECVSNIEQSGGNSLLGNVNANETFVLTDNESYLLSVRCQHGGNDEWIFLSTNRVVPDTVKRAVLNKIKEVGFDPEKAEEVDFTACA